MKALSIRQPWAWLICAGYKDIENRNWRAAFRGRVYIHAGKKLDNIGDGAISAFARAYPDCRILNLDKYYGALIGEVDIVGCVTESKSRWFVGKYGFELADPVLYDTPIPCKGKLGFFEPDIKRLG